MYRTQANLGQHAPRSQKLMKQLGKGSAYLESLPISFKEQLQRQKEHGHPWHVLAFVQTKPFLVRVRRSIFQPKVLHEVARHNGGLYVRAAWTRRGCRQEVCL